MAQDTKNFKIKPGQRWRVRHNGIIEVKYNTRHFVEVDGRMRLYFLCSDDVWRSEINGKPYIPDSSMELVAHISDHVEHSSLAHPAADLLIAIANGETNFETEIIDHNTDEKLGYEPISLFYVLTEIAHNRHEGIRVARPDWTKAVPGSEVIVSLSDGRQERMRFVCFMDDTVYCTRDDMIKRLSLCVLPFKSSDVRIVSK